MEPKQTFMKSKFSGLLISGTVSMIVVTALLLSDTFIAGAFLGKEAVEGINLVTPMYSLAAFFGSVFSIGVPIIYNSEMGKFNKNGADKAFGLGLTMTMAIGIIMFALLMLFGDDYLRFYKATNEVFELSRDYFFWYKFTILLLPFSTLMSEMMFADGDETLSTVSGLTQFIGNIAISLLLCKPFGIAGIGFGSFAGTALSLVVSFSHVLRKTNSLRLNFYVSLKMMVSVIKYSIVDAGTYLFIAILSAVINMFVTAAYGENMLILVSVIMLTR
ncbi:MAG: multidrug transporter MatE, partial [Firmicutes bacterium]|nr:multidrug transporter MatE [Bacillota bacterium]